MVDGLSQRRFSEVADRPTLEDILEGSPELASRLPTRKLPADPHVVVTVPCFNEGETVASVICRVPRELPRVADVRILVLDDGSDDGSAAVAAKAGADAVVRHKRNLGLGRTFKDGLEAALRMGADIIVNVDADGQYDPEEMPLLLQPLLDGEADIVVGDRQVKDLDHMPWGRKWGNRLASWVTRRISGLPIRDSQTGFRALTAEAALRLTLDGGYTYTQEMIVQAAYRNLAVKEAPVTFRPRANGRSRLIRSIWGYAARSGTILLRSYRDHNPLRAFTLLGLGFLFLGGLATARVALHFFATGSVTPLIPSALFAAAMGIVGLQVLIFGLLADTMVASRAVNEEILFRLKRRAWERGRASARDRE